VIWKSALPKVVNSADIGEASPDRDGQYQVAYGHRRLEACDGLDASEGDSASIDDQELVTAQGKENLEREDLSFIERAMFAPVLRIGVSIDPY